MKQELHRLSDRHFRPDPQGILLPMDEDAHSRVLLAVSETMASTQAGQHLAWMTVNLLARQYRLVGEIVLRVPQASLLPETAPFGGRPTLADTLRECVTLVGGSHITSSIFASTSKIPDIQISVGHLDGFNHAEQSWLTYADGWRWYVGNGTNIPRAQPTSHLSFGPYLTASIVAGEVFKSLMGMRQGKGEFITESIGSAWTMSTAATWADAIDGPSRHPSSKAPHIYIVGAGAVGQACAATLASSELEFSTTVVDYQELDETNSNRYVLSNLEDIGKEKVDIVHRYLSAKNVHCNPVGAKWHEYVSALGGDAISPEIQTLEQDFRYPLVLSCVDKNKVRHEIQNILPGLIIGGSTDGLVAKAQVYDLSGEYACLKCFNPVEDRNAIVRHNVELLSGMTQSQREQWCSEHGVTEREVELILSPPECGKLGESDLDRFSDTSPEMSVGFVSLAAGVLLAAQAFRAIVGSQEPDLDHGSSINMTFARFGLKSLASRPESSCNCTTELRAKWSRLWEEYLGSDTVFHVKPFD